jgi:hypothetical protein
MTRRPRVPPSTLLPSSIEAIKVILARASFEPDGVCFDVPVDDLDPPQPDGGQRTVSMVRIRNVGYLAFECLGGSTGVQVIMIDTTAAPSITLRRLVRAGSRRPVRMSDLHVARNHLADVVEEGGALPSGWSWDPPATFGEGVWVPRGLGRLEAQRGIEALKWTGATAKWAAESVVWPPGKYVIKRNGRRQPLLFPSMDAAKAFCVEQDQR